MNKGLNVNTAGFLTATRQFSEPKVNYIEALAFYDATLQTHPDRYAWTGRGSALLNLGQYEEAVSSYDRAIALQADETAWYHRGEALFHLGRYPEALRSYDRALEIEPDFEAALYSKARTLACLNQVELALKYLQATLELSPNEYGAILAKDSCFDSLRKHPTFQAMLNRSIS